MLLPCLTDAIISASGTFIPLWTKLSRSTKPPGVHHSCLPLAEVLWCIAQRPWPFAAEEMSSVGNPAQTGDLYEVAKLQIKKATQQHLHKELFQFGAIKYTFQVFGFFLGGGEDNFFVEADAFL